MRKFINENWYTILFKNTWKTRTSTIQQLCIMIRYSSLSYPSNNITCCSRKLISSRLVQRRKTIGPFIKYTRANTQTHLNGL